MSKKIAILSSSFSDGGAERVMSYLVNNSDQFIPFSLSDRLDYLNTPGNVIKNNISTNSNRLIRKIRSAAFAIKVVYKHRCVLTCSYELFLLTSIAALLFPGRKIIFRPSIGMDYISSEMRRRFGFFSSLIMALFRLLCKRSGIIFQSEALKDSFSGCPARNWMVIFNPVVYEQASIRAFSKNKDAPLRIVYAGRLTWEKGFDRWLECHALQQVQSPEVIWDCYGAGALEDDAIRRKNCSSDFQYHGWTSRTHFASENAVMVIPSRIEGAPNIVLEAIMGGWPIIASQEVCEIFANDPIVHSQLYCFDFDKSGDLVKMAKRAVNNYNFEDHMEVVNELRNSRQIFNYVASIVNFCHGNN